MSFTFKINGTKIEGVTSLEFKYADLQKNSKRNALGVVRFDMVRTDVRVLSIKLEKASPAIRRTLFNALRNQDKFTCQFYDVSEDEIITKTFYKGDRTVKLFNHHDEQNAYADISVDFVEE